MKFKILSLLAIGLLLISCKSNPPLATINREVDINKYAGKWFEIAKLPNRFQKNCDCATAQYSLLPNGNIEVLNTCVKPDGSIKDIKGKARAVSPMKDKLEVSFFPLIWGDYWILDLDKDYQYVLVGEPSRKYLWILFRTEKLDEAVYQRLITKAKNLGFPVDKIEKSARDCAKN